MRRAILILATWVSAAAASAAPALGPSRHLAPADFFALEFASDPQISPDGRTVAYVRASNGIMTDRLKRSIWLVDTANGKLSTGLNDPRVEPCVAAKMTARLIENGNRRSVLLRMPDASGHGRGETHAMSDAEAADFIAFVLWRAGVSEWQPRSQ